MEETTEGEQPEKENNTEKTLICGFTLLMLFVTCFYMAIGGVMFGIILVGVVVFIFIDGLASSLATSNSEFYVASFWKLIIWVVVFVPVIAVIFSQGVYLLKNVKERYVRLRVWTIRKTYNQLVQYYDDGKREVHWAAIMHPVIVSGVALLICIFLLDMSDYLMVVGFIYIVWYILVTLFLLALRSFYRVIKLASDRWNNVADEKWWWWKYRYFCCPQCWLIGHCCCCDRCNKVADNALDLKQNAVEQEQEQREKGEEEEVEVDEFYVKVMGISKYGLVTDSYVEWTSFMSHMDEAFEPRRDDFGNMQTCTWHRICAWIFACLMFGWMCMHFATNGVSYWAQGLGFIYFLPMPLYTFFSPMLASCNVLEMIDSILNHREERKIADMQYYCTIAALALAAAVCGSMILFSIISVLFFRTRHNQLSIPDVNEPFKLITTSEPASMCGTRINDWPIMDLIGLAAMASLYDTKRWESQRNSVMDTNDELYWYKYDEYIVDVSNWSYLTPENPNIELLHERQGIYLFRSLDNPMDYRYGKEAYVVVDRAEDGRLPIGMMVENSAMDFIDMVCEAIPLMNWFYNSLREALHAIFVIFMSSFVHEPISIYMGVNLQKALHNGNISTEYNSVVIGHGASGLNAKYMTTIRNVHAVAFEAPKLEDSVLNVRYTGKEEFAIYNFLSESSIFASYDKAARMNYRIGDSDISIPTVYETLCMMAAGCTMSNAYDQICHKVVGEETYASYFEKWNRVRIK